MLKVLPPQPEEERAYSLQEIEYFAENVALFAHEAAGHNHPNARGLELLSESINQAIEDENEEVTIEVVEVFYSKYRELMVIPEGVAWVGDAKSFPKTDVEFARLIRDLGEAFYDDDRYDSCEAAAHRLVSGEIEFREVLHSARVEVWKIVMDVLGQDESQWPLGDKELLTVLSTPDSVLIESLAADVKEEESAVSLESIVTLTRHDINTINGDTKSAIKRVKDQKNVDSKKVLRRPGTRFIKTVKDIEEPPIDIAL